MMMTRDRSNSQLRPSKSANNHHNTNQQSFNNHSHQFHHVNHHKIVQFEPFCLISQDDRSLKQAAELVENAALNRFKVCVVTIISKDSLDGAVKNYLVQAALNRINNNTSNKRRQNNNNRNSKQHEQRGQHTLSKALANEDAVSSSAQDTNASKSLVDELLLVNDYENQVVGQVDSKADVIVLNLTSFLEADKICSLSETIDELFKSNLGQEGEQLRQSFISNSWPKWNQNLIKTLLILFVMSHIIVFYNPEPSIDYNLIHIFKILETLRLKSQNRIADLLETIASNQMFPQQWIRQGRLSCPRALFVCDCSRLDVRINQSDVAAIKRDLEDQIYILLKKTNITCRPVVSSNQQSQQSTLLSLPERDDFVFIMTRQDLTISRNRPPANSRAKLRETQNLDDFYSRLFRSLQISSTDKLNTCDNGTATTVTVTTPVPVAKNQQIASAHDDEGLHFQDEPENSNQADAASAEVAPDDVPAAILMEWTSSVPIRFKSNSHQNRFRKFLIKHITDIQNVAQVDQENNSSKHYSAKQTTLLPRYDDFFTVLLRLKCLLFPMQSQSNDDESQATANVQEPNSSWLAPDERRFVDIYDLVNSDELFSKQHCHKARLAAFDYYMRLLRAPPSNHSNSLFSAKEFYLNHARGSACDSNLKLLVSQCNKYWQSLGNSESAAHDSNDAFGGRFFKGNRLSRTKSSDTPAENFAVSQDHLPPQNSVNQRTKPNLLISRRNNGIKMMTCCDCGRQSNFIITPVDRKKKLERVDIHRLND